MCVSRKFIAYKTICWSARIEDCTSPYASPPRYCTSFTRRCRAKLRSTFDQGERQRGPSFRNIKAFDTSFSSYVESWRQRRRDVKKEQSQTIFFFSQCTWEQINFFLRLYVNYSRIKKKFSRGSYKHFSFVESFHLHLNVYYGKSYM